MMQDRVSITRHDHVAHVEMIREDKMNALDKGMMEGLVEAAETLSQEDDIRAVVLSGKGRAFCAGLDVSNFASMMKCSVAKHIFSIEINTFYIFLFAVSICL